MQGLWQLSDDQALNSFADPLQQAAELCLVVSELLGVLVSYEGGLESAADLLNIATTSWEVQLVLSECQQEFNQLLQAESESAALSTEQSSNFLQRLSSGDSQVPTVQRPFINVGAPQGTQSSGAARKVQQFEQLSSPSNSQDTSQDDSAHEQVWQAAEVPTLRHASDVELSGGAPRRRLTARVSRKVAAGTGEVQSAVRSADVSSQNWTIADLPVETMRIEGTVLRPRDFGRGNTMLGGLVLTQTRRKDSFIRQCSSGFSHLISRCSKAQLSTDARVYNSRVPFGRDPGFNFASPLFSQTAVLSEDQFYNMSAGSSEISAQGYPAAFHPVQLQGSKEFIVVFPVSCSKALPENLLHV